jgi:hypothetical protein
MNDCLSLISFHVTIILIIGGMNIFILKNATSEQIDMILNNTIYTIQ